MEDSISRQALYKKACENERIAMEHINNMNPEEREELVVWLAILAERTSFKFDVIDAPSAQQKGRWIKNDNGTWYCSMCKSWIPNEQHEYARFCLHCGADMRGEDDA